LVGCDNNNQNELSDTDEDYLYFNDTSFTVDDHNDYYGNVDYVSRCDTHMAYSELTEALSKQTFRKWFNELKESSVWKNERVERNVASASTLNMSNIDDTGSSETLPSSSTNSQSNYLSKSLIP
jgi:hypothetical protein